MPQLRQDPVAGYWVAISKERSKRPIEFARAAPIIQRAGICPFCPGNEALTPPEVLAYPSAAGDTWRLRVVPNKYPALLHDGVHEVIIESPEHRHCFGDLPRAAAVDLLRAAQERFQVLKLDSRLRYIQLFKNHGPGAGASLEHSHSQLMALPVVPVQIDLELDGSLRFRTAHRRCIFCNMFDDPEAAGRVVQANADVLVIAPYAPRFPHETWIVPRRHASHFEASDAGSLAAVAAALHDTLRVLERELNRPSYNFLLHTAPLHEAALDYYHWHIEILPRMTGMGGYEFGTGCYINSVSPEESAARLRS